MRKLDIARRIHQEAGISEEEAATVLDWILQFLKATLQKGEPISVAKFGVFTVRSKAARQGRNPITGEPVMIPPHRAISFRASSHFKEEVNGFGRTTNVDGLLPKGK